MAWSEAELERLRARYADDPGGRMHDPKFAKVAERVFSRGARPAPFVGVPTFLTAPLPAGRPRRRRTSPGSTWRSRACRSTSAPRTGPGTRFGPRAVRTIERVGPYNHVLDCAPIYDLAVADVGDVPFSWRYDLAAGHARDRGLDRGDRGGRARGRCRSAAIIRSPIRSCARSGATAGRPRAHRRPFRHRRAVRRAAREPRRAVPQRGARRRARPDPHGPDRAARLVGVSLRVRRPTAA